MNKDNFEGQRFVNIFPHFPTKHERGFMKAKVIFIGTIACALFAVPGPAQELPVPTYSNSIVISIEHNVLNDAEVDYIKSHFNFGLYAWLSFSKTALVPILGWHSNWAFASSGIQNFKDEVNAMLAKAIEKNVKLHFVLCSGVARGLSIYQEAKEEDIRNTQWYNDNKLASDSQITDPGALYSYIFGTFSRYARKMRANIEAKTKAAVAFLKQTRDENPDVLIAVSGWGEAEMNFGRLSGGGPQDFFCDYSPFAVLEFRDWIQHAGMYDDTFGLYKGQSYTQGGTKYQGALGLSQFNTDFATSFSTWDLKYFNWSLADDYDQNPEDDVNNDPNRIPWTSYSHDNMIPDSGSNYVPGGFDPPRTMVPGNKFYDLWNLFRETMVANFVKDLAKWASEADFPSDKWYSHQVPADYLFGTNPSMSVKNERYYSSASPMWTANIQPYASAGATIYDIKFYDSNSQQYWFARTSQYAVPAMAAMSPNWAIMEFDPESYPFGMGIVQSDVPTILNQYMNVYNNHVHLINFYEWLDRGDHQIKGMNKEEALRQFIEKVRDQARSLDLNKVFDPPKVVGLSGAFVPATSHIQLQLTGRIWNGQPWNWKDWGDFIRFQVFRGTDPNFIADSSHLIGTTDTYQHADSSIQAGQAYFYKVKAVNANNVAGPASDSVMVLSTTAASPVLYVDKKSLSFKTAEGGAAPWPEPAAVSNIGPAGTAVNWTSATDKTWIAVTPASGAGNSTIKVAVNPQGLGAGNYSGRVTITDPAALNSPQAISISLNVSAPADNQPPFGAFDTPANGSTVSGSIAVTGWALDDLGVDKVVIKRDPHPDDPPAAIGVDGLVYIGDTLFVKGARPDIESLYPNYSHSDKAGWGYMLLTYGLPRKGNGVFRIHAIAEDVGGKKVKLGVKQITSDNNSRVKPFGNIDTPGQGEAISGASYSNFGWALTPVPKLIPVDGSTIWVVVDSIMLSHPIYNLYRSDIAGAFPECLNASGAIGLYTLDTTPLTNGIHTIGWLVYDDAGEGDGIGSRFFEVQNMGGASASAGRFETLDRPEDDSGKLGVEIVGPAVVRVEELGMVQAALKARGGRRFVGWAASKDKPLPIGSTLDKETGVFTWMPAPGFLGRHVLHFAVTDGARMSRPATLIINIVPKNYEKAPRRDKDRAEIKK